MSWDIWIINAQVKTPMDEINESQLKDFGGFDELIQKLNAVVPEIDWTNETYPNISNEDYQGHIGLGKKENRLCDSIMFHVYGGNNPIKTITDVCKKYDWLAIDTTTEQYLDIDTPDESGWNQFQDFRRSLHEQIGGKLNGTISRSTRKWWEFWKN